MTSLTLGPPGGPSVNILDRAKYKHTPMRPAPNREKSIGGSGCGLAPGATAALKTDRVNYWTKRYQIQCIDVPGGSYQACKVNRDALIAQVGAASAWNRKDQTSSYWTGRPVVLTQSINNETAPTLWTVITGIWLPDHEEYSSLPCIWGELELDCMEGYEFLDGSGNPILGAGGDILVM